MKIISLQKSLIYSLAIVLFSVSTYAQQGTITINEDEKVSIVSIHSVNEGF